MTDFEDVLMKGLEVLDNFGARVDRHASAEAVRMIAKRDAEIERLKKIITEHEHRAELDAIAIAEFRDRCAAKDRTIDRLLSALCADEPPPSKRDDAEQPDFLTEEQIRTDERRKLAAAALPWVAASEADVRADALRRVAQWLEGGGDETRAVGSAAFDESVGAIYREVAGQIRAMADGLRPLPQERK